MAGASTQARVSDDESPPAPPTAPRPRLVIAAPQRRWRSLRAWRTALVVIGSYLWLRVSLRLAQPSNHALLRSRCHRTNAQRVHALIARLQGIYIKVGQFISIMTNFLPKEYVEELAGLQDQVPPRPYRDIERRLREELGQAPSALFAELCEEPVAAASIGQVHRAKLRTGESVAVKVQYPDIEQIVRQDLATLRGIFRLIGWIFFHPILDTIYDEVRKMVMAELDFRREAQNLEQIANQFAASKEVGFPTVHHALSTGRVLVTSWCDGWKATDKARLAAAKVDPGELARRIVHAYCTQIFKHGTYHADPHPGNLLVVPDGAGDYKLVFIDFGAVCELGPSMRHGIAEVVQAAVTRDTERLSAAMKQMGFIKRGGDEAVFDKVIDYLHQRFQEEVQLDSFSLSNIKSDFQQKKRALHDLRQMNLSVRDLGEHFYIPKEWILLERTLLLLTGLCTELQPQLNPFEIIRPYAEELVLGKEGDYGKLVVDATKNLTATVLALPQELRRAVASLQRGELEMGLRGLDGAADRVYAVGQQIVFAITGSAAVAVALVSEGRGQTERAELAWAIAAIAGLGVVYRMVRRK